MKHIIQRSIAGEGIKWEKSASFPWLYSMDEAQAILDEYPQMNYRISPVTVKPYRRHAAVTQLELRGAHAMLSEARKHIAISARASCNGPCDANYFLPFSILTDAMLSVTRQMEAL
jgi:hypothetical protein